jgi:hypothetical protein
MLTKRSCGLAVLLLTGSFNRYADSHTIKDNTRSSSSQALLARSSSAAAKARGCTTLRSPLTMVNSSEGTPKLTMPKVRLASTGCARLAAAAAADSV